MGHPKAFLHIRNRSDIAAASVASRALRLKRERKAGMIGFGRGF
ncbi:hypothetical protein SFHH103_03055 [Sinorhizobium fredii HH103]|uniref:Uncharacterized protein n=1 Tax=Sinorhizobium fredii (strain HH103) TaxID=1117943 RepID=G9A1G7_SINF1|nr:hypothetical protein SFHH103_03055 [Sinorhizobium fredii HH103]